MRPPFQNCGLENPPDTALFAAAQQQIYNLMKFDSFSRYIYSLFQIPIQTWSAQLNLDCSYFAKFGSGSYPYISRSVELYE